MEWRYSNSVHFTTCSLYLKIGFKLHYIIIQVYLEEHLKTVYSICFTGLFHMQLLKRRVKWSGVEWSGDTHIVYTVHTCSLYLKIGFKLHYLNIQVYLREHLHSTPLHSTPLHSTPLHSTPLHSTPLHFTRRALAIRLQRREYCACKALQFSYSQKLLLYCIYCII